MIANKQPSSTIASLMREKIRNSISYFSMPVQNLRVLNSMLILSAATSIFLFLRLLFNNLGKSSQGFLIGATTLLSIWIVGISIRRFHQNQDEISRFRVLVWLIKTTLLIAVVYFAHPILSRWATLFIPAATADRLLTSLWLFLIPVIGISLFVWKTNSWNGDWKAFLAGVCGGSLLVYLWAPLAYVLSYNLFVPGIKFHGDGFYELSQWALGIGVGILFLSGVLSLYVGKPAGRQQALSLLVITGLTISLFLFTSLGSTVSGIASQASLYGVAFSRVGYDEAGWIDALVRALLYVFPWVQGTLLACIAMGALPILIGLIWPIKKNYSLSFPEKNLSASIPAILLMLFSAIIFLLTAFVLLTEKIINTFEAAGTISWWDPEWIVPTILTMPSLVITLLLIRVLVQLPSRTHSFRNAIVLRTIGGVIFLSAIGIHIVYADAPWIVLLLIGAGVELFFQARRLAPPVAHQNTQPDLTEQPEPPTSIVSRSAPIALLLSLPALVISLVMALVSVRAIAELRNVTDPPPGGEWLFQLTESFLFTTPPISWSFNTGLFVFLFSVVYGIYWVHPRTSWNSSEKIIAQIVNVLRIKSSGGTREYVFVTLLLLPVIFSILFGSSTLSVLSLMLLVLWILINAGQESFRNYSMLTYAVAAAIIVSETVFLAYQRDLPATTFESTIVLWPAFAVLYAGLASNDGKLWKSLVRMFFLTATGVLATLIINFANPVTLVENGIARLSRGRWEVLDFREGYLVSDRNYALSGDPQGRLWFISYFGPDAVQQDGEWSRLRSYSNVSEFLSDTKGRLSRLETPGLFLEQDGNYWFTSESNVYMLVPTTNGYVSYIPRRSVGAPPDATQVINRCGAGYECPDLKQKNITAALIDKSGSLWVGTDGAGLIRFLPDRSPDDAVWDYFTAESGSISSDRISDLLEDGQGNLWILGPASVSVLSSQKEWTTYSLDEIGLTGTLQTIHQDGEQVIWVGSTNGIARWNTETWMPSPEFHGSVNSFYEDSKARLWALTSSGTYQYSNGKWLFFMDIPEDPLWQNPFRISSFYSLESYGTGINIMTEEQDGILWFGGPRGLLKYDPVTDQAEYLYPSNSGLPSENVRNLLVDSNNVLWVSTYTLNRAYRSELPVVGFAMLFMGLVLANIYSQYQKSPHFRAGQISRRLANEPQSILNEIYATFMGPNPGEVLGILTRNLRTHREFHELALAYSEINPASDIAPKEKASHIFQALRHTPALSETQELANLYLYFSKALSILSVNDIAQQQLQVLRPEDGTKITITDDKSIPYELPKSVDSRLADPLEMIGKSSALLRKYLQIDNTQDKLSFIADSLGAVERAKRDAISVSGPENFFIVQISNLWLDIISRELDVLSGHADLRVEFRTKQVKQSDEATLVLRIKNVGSAIANQVQISLLPNEQLHLHSKATHHLDHIGAGNSETVEFSITDPPAGDVRIAGELVWSDRIETNNYIEFADVVRFYESTGRFERIPNPYIVGHPVKSPSLFQGREDIFDFISHNIHGTTQSRTLVLYGQRRTGKTSILYQLAGGRLGKNYVPVLVDVQELAAGIHGMADLFMELAFHIEKALKRAGLESEPIDEQSYSTSPTRSFSRFLTGIEPQLAGRKIVLMFDEFELLEERIHRGKLEPESLGYLRSLMQHRDDLVFIFTGTHKLEQMSKDYWSIFFNIALHQQISFMEADAAVRLIREPVQGKLSIDDLVVEKLLSLAQGHPYFIQLLCWALVNYCNKKEKNYATLNDLNEVLKEIVSTGEAYFAYIWTQVSSGEKMVMCALAERLAPGKNTISLQEIIETIAIAGVQNIDKAAAIKILDGLTNQEILASSGHGGLLYSYRVGLIGEWVKSSKPLRHLVEREL